MKLFSLDAYLSRGIVQGSSYSYPPIRDCDSDKRCLDDAVALHHRREFNHGEYKHSDQLDASTFSNYDLYEHRGQHDTLATCEVFCVDMRQELRKIFAKVKHEFPKRENLQFTTYYAMVLNLHEFQVYFPPAT